jgi:hypothetical protein
MVLAKFALLAANEIGPERVRDLLDLARARSPAPDQKPLG